MKSHLEFSFKFGEVIDLPTFEAMFNKLKAEPAARTAGAVIDADIGELDCDNWRITIGTAKLRVLESNK